MNPPIPIGTSWSRPQYVLVEQAGTESQADLNSEAWSSQRQIKAEFLITDGFDFGDTNHNSVEADSHCDNRTQRRNGCYGNSVGGADSSRRNDEQSNMPPVNINLRINGRGEPQGSGESVVKQKLFSVVRKHVPVEIMWRQVSPERKYTIYRELQSRFVGGEAIDPSWIKTTARIIHYSARRKAKTDLWRRHCLSSEAASLHL
ncbi:unnamed protein product [Calypogeia fissa]